MPSKITPNENGLLVFLGILLGFCKAPILAKLVTLVWSTLTSKEWDIFNPSNWPTSGKTTYDAFSERLETFASMYFVTFFLFLVSFAAYIILCGGTVMIGKGTFRDRTKFSYFLHISGFTGARIDVILYQCILFACIIVGEDTLNLRGKIISPSLKKSYVNNFFDLLLNDKAFPIGLIGFFTISIVLSLLSSVSKKFDHPSVAGYVDVPKPSIQKNNLKSWTTVIMLINITYKIFFFVVYLEQWKNDKISKDTWNTEFIDIFKLSLFFGFIPLSIFREGYLLFVTNEREKVHSVTTINSFFMMYLLFTTYQFDSFKQNNIYFFLIPLMILLNLICYAIVNWRQMINLAIFLCKKGSSNSTVAAISLIFFFFFSISGLILHAISFPEQWFKFHFKFFPVLQALIDFAKILFEIVKSIMSFFKSLMEIVFNDALSLLLCIGLFIMILLAIALNFIPFGGGSGSYFATIFPKLTRKLKKFGEIVVKFRSSAKSIKKYAGKISGMSDPVTVDVSQFLGIILMTICLLPQVLGIAAMSLAVFERFTDIGRIDLSIFGIVFIVLTTIFLTVLLTIKFIIVREFDLGIMVIWFSTTSDFTMLIASFAFAFIAVIAYFLHLICFKETNLSDTKLNDLVSQHVISPAKPTELMGAPSEQENAPVVYKHDGIYEVVNHTYLLKDLCDSCCPCRKSDIEEKPSEIICLIFKNIFSCIWKVNDRRPVCKYNMRKFFPCQHSDMEEDCFRRYHSCNICGQTIDCDMADIDTSMINWKEPGRIALINMYLLLAACFGFMIYKAVTSPFYEIKTSLGVLLASLMKDTGSKSNSDEYKAQDSEQAGVCVNEIMFLIKAIAGGVLSSLEDSNPQFKKLIDTLSKLNNKQGSSSVGNFFDIIVKIMLLWEAVACQLLLLVITIVFTFYNEIELETEAIIVSIVLISGGAGSMLEFASTVNTLFALIPFIVLEIQNSTGWMWGIGSYALVFLTVLFRLVDRIAPPIDAKEPLDLDEQIFAADEDERNPLNVNLDLAEETIAKYVFGEEHPSEALSFDL